MFESSGYWETFGWLNVWKRDWEELARWYFSVFVLSVDCKCKKQFYDILYMPNVSSDLSFKLLINKSFIAVLESNLIKVYSAVLYTSSYSNKKYMMKS